MNAYRTWVGHRLLHGGNAAGYLAFQRACRNVEYTQRTRLRMLLAQAARTPFGRAYGLTTALTWEELRDRVPVTDYPFWQGQIERQMDGTDGVLSPEPCRRYQPTSGSTSPLKWIPYTARFLRELHAATAPWLVDLYHTYPGLRHGRHYWSLSWLPTHLRQHHHSNDDMELLPPWQQWLMQQTMAVPGSLARVGTAAGALFATAVYLCACLDLVLLSVWSPTFALSLLRYIEAHREAIATTLRTGQWTWHAEALRALTCPHAPQAAEHLQDATVAGTFHPARLWPRLALISAWSTASAAPWAAQLQRHFPSVPLQGKGLWATEGVVTIPFAGQTVLAVKSHFYEFRCLRSGNLVAPWHLRIGQEVQPLMSTGNGIWRYALQDRLRVVGHLHQCPALEFLGRLDGTDLVGEKLSVTAAQQVLSTVARRSQVRSVSLLAVQAEPPHYVLLGETLDDRNAATLADLTEQVLSVHMHYRLARQLGQLGPARVHLVKDVLGFFEHYAQSKGIPSGNLKIEPLMQWDRPTLEHTPCTPQAYATATGS